MFRPVSIDDFVKKHVKSNPGTKAADIRAALKEAVEAKRKGMTCLTDMGDRIRDSRSGLVLYLHDGGKRQFGRL